MFSVLRFTAIWLRGVGGGKYLRVGLGAWGPEARKRVKGVTENTDDWQLTADIRVSGTVGWGGDKGKPRPCPPVAAVLQQQLTGDRPE